MRPGFITERSDHLHPYPSARVPAVSPGHVQGEHVPVDAPVGHAPFAQVHINHAHVDYAPVVHAPARPPVPSVALVPYQPSGLPFAHQVPSMAPFGVAPPPPPQVIRVARASQLRVYDRQLVTIDRVFTGVRYTNVVIQLTQLGVSGVTSLLGGERAAGAALIGLAVGRGTMLIPEILMSIWQLTHPTPGVEPYGEREHVSLREYREREHSIINWQAMFQLFGRNGVQIAALLVLAVQNLLTSDNTMARYLACPVLFFLMAAEIVMMCADIVMRATSVQPHRAVPRGYSTATSLARGAVQIGALAVTAASGIEGETEQQIAGYTRVVAGASRMATMAIEGIAAGRRTAVETRRARELELTQHHAAPGDTILW